MPSPTRLQGAHCRLIFSGSTTAPAPAMTQRPEPRSKRAPSLMVRAIPTERRLGTSLIGHLEDLRRAYGALDGLALLRAVLREGPLAGRAALVSSFGAESAVLLDMVATIDPAIPVIFLDTGKLFEETQDYRDELTRLLGLRDVRVVRPDPAALARQDPGGRLFAHQPDLCCHLRKTEPLERALAGFAAWISGRKRFQGGPRSTCRSSRASPRAGESR